MTKLHFRPYIPNQTLLFSGRIDEDIAANDPVRIVSSLVDILDLSEIKELYKEYGRSPYHPGMMLKVIIYAYMNNVYSCRKIENYFFEISITSGLPAMRNRTLSPSTVFGIGLKTRLIRYLPS